MYGKMKNDPNHQPESEIIINHFLVEHPLRPRYLHETCNEPLQKCLKTPPEIDLNDRGDRRSLAPRTSFLIKMKPQISRWWYTYPSEKYELVIWNNDSQHLEK